MCSSDLEPLSATGIDLLRSIIKRTTSNFSLNLKCGGIVFTIAEENTIVFKDAVKFIDNNDFWKGKRYKKSLPKRTIVARSQGNQGYILDTDDNILKLSIAAITKELLERIGLDE